MSDESSEFDGEEEEYEDDEDSDGEGKKNREDDDEPLPKREELGLKPYPECIVSREEWGASAPSNNGKILQHPIKNVVFIYNTSTEQCEEEDKCVKIIQELQRQHKQTGMSDIAYNFIIGGDLRVYEGRGWNVQSDPSNKFPELGSSKLDIGFLGNPNFSNNKEKYATLGLVGLGMDFAHYGVGEKYLQKKYRLLESENLIIFQDYVPNQKEEYPELSFHVEDHFPGNKDRYDGKWEEELLEEDDRDINMYEDIEDVKEEGINQDDDVNGKVYD